jgi:inner membrane protein
MLFFGHIGFTVGAIFLIYLFLKGTVDYRYVIVGSMLPDIVDKPLGIYLLGQTFDNGRIFCHTLLFVCVLFILGVYLDRYRRFAVVKLLALAAFFHLLEDEMWQVPRTFYWPLLGFDFKERLQVDFVSYIMIKNSTDIFTYVTEAIGIAILLVFIYHYGLFKPENLKSFLLHGTLAHGKGTFSRGYPEGSMADRMT